MEEKGTNGVWQLCFHMGLHTHLPKVRKLWLWLKVRQSCSFPHPGLWAAQRKGCTLLPGQQSRELALCPGSAAPNRSPMGSWGNGWGPWARQGTRPACKKASHLCGKGHYGCIHTVLFQMSPSAVLYVPNFRSGLTPLYVLVTPTVGIARPFCVIALVLLRKGGASLPQAFEWLRVPSESKSTCTSISVLKNG